MTLLIATCVLAVGGTFEPPAGWKIERRTKGDPMALLNKLFGKALAITQESVEQILEDRQALEEILAEANKDRSRTV